MDWGLVARLFVFGFIGAWIGLRLSRARRMREERTKEERQEEKDRS
jgi:uncharacterized membrane protein YfcA